MKTIKKSKITITQKPKMVRIPILKKLMTLIRPSCHPKNKVIAFLVAIPVIACLLKTKKKVTSDKTHRNNT